LVVQEAGCDVAVSVDSPITKEGPITADILNASCVHLGKKNLLFVRRGFCGDYSLGIGHE
jgi:hypothetical protein